MNVLPCAAALMEKAIVMMVAISLEYFITAPKLRINRNIKMPARGVGPAGYFVSLISSLS